MKCFIYIDNNKIGKVDFEIIDETMGAISGDLIPTDNYEKYQPTIRQHFELKGISNVEDFNYRITLENGTELNPSGGIGVIDSAEFGELKVESAGLDLSNFEETQNLLVNLKHDVLSEICKDPKCYQNYDDSL